MGGKTKQAQRTKNNSRPSNSGRSAELLGTTIPSFVGFTVHTDLGLVPLAPGFSTVESLPDTFDSSVSSQCQLVLRKMSKKDPITKVKALQEFSELVSESDVDFVKTILPLWPKFYHNLANDVEHRVRESAQQAQNAVVTKAGKLIAPYLKQLAPVWISSQFDNYAPVASLASSTFNASFSPKKVQEVFTFCQNEILDYIIKNLTFHTATTLSNTKSCTPEEAENKYQRVIVCSLKSLALYLEKTSGKQTPEIEEKLKNLLQNQKFWSFSKHKATNIRAAWFEILFAFLQHAPNVVEANKNQIIQVTFQNMDDSDPLTLPHVWGCILLIQTIFDDWHVSINFKKAVLPKLSQLLKNAAKTNFDVVHPSLLPFISKFSDDTIPNYSLQEFYTDFFNNIKLSITSLDNSASKAVIGSITATFYECIRYVVQQKNVTIEKSTETPDVTFCQTILNDYIIDVIKWSLTNETIATKYIFIHISTLIAYWSQNSETSQLYADILEQFWSQIKQLISEDIDYTEEYLKHLVDFIQNLYNASPYHHDNKVKFSDEQDEAAKNTKSKNVVYLLHKRLKEIAIDLARLLIEKSSKEKTVNYITQLKCLTDMFGDAAFYSDITKDNNLQSTVEIFSTFLNEKEPPESAIDIIFEVMMLMEKVERYQHVEKLLKIPNNIVHQWILQRLLSYPLCIEPEIREILSQKHVSEMILKITKEVIEENSKEKFNLLHKCFFQMESGEILINSETVDGIIRIMSEPLITEGMEEMLDTCGSFIAQIMPVICSDNSTKELQHDVFLKLFKFSVNMVENDNLSEDTLWEITTCWQDALSSNDIVMDEMLLINCAKIIEQKISQDDDLAIQEINNIADVTAKLILCSTENLSSEDERNNQIDKIIDQLLDTTSEKYRNSYDYVKNLCLYFESIRGVMTASALRENFNEELPVNDFRNFFRKQLLNVSTVLKLVCNIRTEKQSDIGDNKPLSEDDQEYTEDYFDPNEHLLKVWSEKIYSHILQSINIAAIGESLLVNSTMINDDDEYVILNLTEKCSLILKHSAESFILTIKDRIFETASTTEISWIRTIPFLLNTTQYSDTENGPIILYEDACSYMLENSRFISYINITHIMMPKLGNKNLPINYDVLANSVDLTIRETALRCLISNHFTGDYNQLSDKKIINQCCSLIDEIANKHKEVDNTLLLCDRDIQPVELSKVIFVTEYINLLAEAVEKFSTQLTLKNWDSIRIGLSWWTLSVSKSLENYKNLKVSIFISRVFKLYDALTKFIIDGKTKSSTSMLTNIIDEWENLFSKEVNIVLFKSYYNLVSFVDSTDHVNSGSALLDEIGTYVENLEYSDIFEASKSGFKITTNDIVNFILHNLSNNIYSVRIACLYMLQQLTKLLVSIDFSNLDKHTETVEGNKNAADDQNNEWHLLNKFSPYLLKYENQIHEYIEEFSYKLTELPNLKKINREAALSYLLIWDSIIYICAQAPAELRSIYATWIRDNKYEQTLLNFLFRAMPIEILKNHDSKIMNNDMFRTINWQQHKDPQLSTERYACYLYSQMLRHLPAVVRKWWNATNARQKTFVDKLTTNFVSSLICQEELRAIVEKKEKHENMQVTVHTSTREVVAVYSIDEARMELVITLAPNHPLGAVKVESRKQIGGRAQSRNVGMQLTIFLTHQNGSIFDGLYLWKRNLDKKFEGVEECYVCYTVIHQDTCQLPKLTCQTCKKKFHGPCLYKWFTTSSKSTCPICRNVF